MKFQGDVSGCFSQNSTENKCRNGQIKAARNISLKSYKDMTIGSIHAEFPVHRKFFKFS